MTDLEARLRRRRLARNRVQELWITYSDDPALSAIFDGVMHQFDSAVEAAQSQIDVARAMAAVATEGDA